MMDKDYTHYNSELEWFYDAFRKASKIPSSRFDKNKNLTRKSKIDRLKRHF